MAAKKSPSPSRKKATSSMRTLEAKQHRAEEKAARWKGKAKIAQAEVADLTRRVGKLEKKLAKARSKVREPAPVSDRGRVASVTAEAPGETGATRQPSGSPDATWTVAQLRAEARSRGISGLSNKPKSVLIEALSRPAAT